MIDLMWTGSWVWGTIRDDEAPEYETGHFEDVASLQSPVRSLEWPHVYLANRVFDLASLTKVISTSTLLAKLFEKNAMFSGQSFREFCDTPVYRKSTLGELWSHQGGFEAHEFLGPAQDRRKTLDRTELERAIHEVSEKKYHTENLGKTIYSDIGFWHLGLFLEKTEKKSLRELWAEFCKNNLKSNSIDAFLDYGPFYMGQKAFEKTLHTEMRHSKGQVNDDNANCWGGAAPHAGLFGNLEGVMGWVKWVFAEFDRKSLLSKSWLNPNNASSVSSRFFCGWDRPSSPLESSQAGYPAPKNCLGHLGFTGTSFWLDFESRKFGVLLTNRVFTDASNAQSLELVRSLRRKFFSLLWNEQDDSRKNELWKKELTEKWLIQAEQM